MIDPELALKLTPEQLMLHCAGIRRWPECPRKPACPGDACLGECPPLSEWHGTMPPYLEYTGTLQPIAYKKAPEALLRELPTVEEIDQALALIPPSTRKWRVLFVEAVPHQIDSTHADPVRAEARAKELGEKYQVKEVVTLSPQHEAVALLERVKAISQQVAR